MTIACSGQDVWSNQSDTQGKTSDNVKEQEAHGPRPCFNYQTNKCYSFEKHIIFSWGYNVAVKTHSTLIVNPLLNDLLGS